MATRAANGGNHADLGFSVNKGYIPGGSLSKVYAAAITFLMKGEQGREQSTGCVALIAE